MNPESHISRVMTTEVVTIDPAMPIPSVAKLLLDHDISGAPVVENGQPVGIITEADIVSWQMSADVPAYGSFLDAIIRFPWDSSDDDVERVLATTAGELMSSPVVTARADDTIADVSSMMFKQKVNPIPVVDATGALVGIVSRSDIVQLVAGLGQ